MLNVKDLERRWLKYKLKSFTPYILGSTLALSAVIGAVSFFLLPGHTTSTKTSKTVPEQNVSSIRQNNQPATQDNPTVLEPSMEFIQSFQTDLQDQKTQPAAAVKAASSSSARGVLEAAAPPGAAPAAPAARQTAPVSKKADGSLSIKRNESQFDIAELQQRFKETSNANLGLFIARYYYDREEYVEAYNYALKTNSINNRIDESWIIFSKSLAKLGKMEQAKKTLRIYLQQSNSETARGLLESLEKGTFK